MYCSRAPRPADVKAGKRRPLIISGGEVPTGISITDCDGRGRTSHHVVAGPGR
jgi:hypothetical protein